MTQRHGAMRVIALSLFMAATPSSASATGGDTDIAAINADPQLREQAIQADVVFRKGLHFRAGRGYVESLYEHLGRTVGNRDTGVLLTPDEYQEYVAREALDEDAAIIMRSIDGDPALAPDFGGMALDNETGELAVFLKPGAEKPWLAQLAHPGRISVREAILSERELQALKREISSAWQAGAEGTGGVTAVGIDTLSNAVHVYFAPGAVEGLDRGEFPVSFRSAFDTAHLVRGVRPGAEGVTPNEVKGAWSWGHSNAGYRCSVGFAVEKAGAPSEYAFVVTAGHCIHSGEGYDPVYHNYGTHAGSDIGIMSPSHSFSSADDMDAALLRIDSTGPDFTTEARVVHATGGTPRALVVIQKVDNQNQGKPRCHTGKGSGFTRCGVVTDSSIDIFYGAGPYSARTIEDLVEIDTTGIDGDSGGPTYYRRESDMEQPNTVHAAGLFVAKSGDGVHGYYVKIQKALDWISDDGGSAVTIKTWSGAPGCAPLSSCPADDGGDY